MVRVLYFRLLLTVLTSTLLGPAVFAPATASPADDPETHRVTITFTSDRQLNGAAVWFDADGRLRTQTDVPLAHQDGRTRLWSATLVYARPSSGEPLDALFQSGGSLSRCEIRVDSVLVADDTVRGPRPTSRCRPRN